MWNKRWWWWCCTHLFGVVLFFIFCTCLQFTLIDIFIPHTPALRTHPTTVIQDFSADAHGLTRKCCWAVFYAPSNRRAWLNKEINFGDGCCCTLFLGVVDFWHLFTVYTNWYIYTTLPLPTHPTTVMQDLCAEAHGLTRKCCWWVVLYAPTNKPHSPTNPFPPSHESRFLRWPASLNSDSDPRTYSGTQKWRKPANAVANKEKLLVGDVVVRTQ